MKTKEQLKEEYSSTILDIINKYRYNNCLSDNELNDITIDKIINIGMEIHNNEINNNEDEYIAVMWPESQELMGEIWFHEEAILINDKIGLKKYGSSAYFIPKNRII